MRRVCWFSCGAASAVAAKLALEEGPVEVVYCNTARSEHPDNERFLGDVERWLGVKVRVIGSTKYETVDEVFMGERYMSGIQGAKCTVMLKKKPRFAWQHPDDVHIFGLTADEGGRIKLFEHNNPELKLEWTLRERGVTKKKALQMIKEAGIELPVMYRLGFRNNNCLGCVKSQSPAYWNLTRRHFPEVFERRALQCRELGVKLVKVKGVRISLDDLPPHEEEDLQEDLSCGPECK